MCKSINLLFVFIIIIILVDGYNYVKDIEEKEIVTEEIVKNKKKIKKKVIKEGVNEKPSIISLGEFKLTAYCPCPICCGKWSGSPTASGVMPTENHTIAVDTDIIPFGTEIMINGIIYTAEDTGSAIKGNIIDIYMSDHQEALEFGVDYAEVFKINE